MSYSVANNARGFVNNNPLLSGGTNLVTDGTLDSKLSALAFPFFLSLYAAGTSPDDAGNGMEIVRVTARPSPSNYTIVRAQQSTSAVQHALNDNCALFWTKGNADDKVSQDSDQIYAADSGSTNALAITLSPVPLTYIAGMTVYVKVANTNSGATTINVNSLGTKTIKKYGAYDLESRDLVAGKIEVLQYDGTNFQLVSGARRNNYSATTDPTTTDDSASGYAVGSIWVNTSGGKVWTCTDPTASAAVWTSPSSKFGGTGADGALSISSGTTTISFASVAFVTKNYTSISITGTGKLAFSNPHTNGTVFIAKSQGNVTITSSTVPCIDGSSMGAAGGATRTTNTGAGNDGSDANRTFPSLAFQGIGGNYSNTATTVTATASNVTPFGDSTGATSQTPWPTYTIAGKGAFVACGGGGGGGSKATGGDGGAGARGGGGIYIECAGALNFTGTVSVAGAAGSNAGAGGGNTAGGGAGGGGAGGTFLLLANTITANTGTVTITGGNGATGGADAGAGEARACAGGNGGNSVINTGGQGGGVTARAGQNGTNGGGTGGGTGGTGTNPGGGGGGGGAAGVSFVGSNTEFS